MVLFHVSYFHATQYGAAFSCLVFSFLAFSASPVKWRDKRKLNKMFAHKLNVRRHETEGKNFSFETFSNEKLSCR